jgi:hypothetical protein
VRSLLRIFADHKRVLANAQETLLELFYGRWRSQTLYVGVKLGIFEIVGSDRKGAEQIARELELDSALSDRLLPARS